MTKVTYKTKTGLTQFRPVFDREVEAELSGDNNIGFCLACGEEAYGVEPEGEAT